ncbi:MAG: ABC transporter: Multidrug resistance-associated protein, ATP binding protein, partial [Streblomastix strix]
MSSNEDNVEVRSQDSVVLDQNNNLIIKPANVFNAESETNPQDTNSVEQKLAIQQQQSSVAVPPPSSQIKSPANLNQSPFPGTSLSPDPLKSPSFSQTPGITPSPTPSPLGYDIINGKKVKHPTLHDISFKLPKGSLTMVIGAVGSGKSSIGAALIGDIEKQKGTINIDGMVAYCPQTAWINNNTVRGNITFGNTYEEKKYNEVVHVCALEPDFETLAAGDMTAIGEKGVNLSGGQKARIQLARAVYSDRDIYILDDPLSAVDAHVGRFLLEECIDGRLKGKTRMLMTNQLQYIDRADNIILLNKGRIIAQGTSAQLKEQGIDFDEFIIKSSSKDKKKKKHHKEKENKEKEKTKEDPKDEKKKEADNKESDAAKQIMTEEEQQTGSVPWSSYFAYVLSLVPIWAIIPFILVIVISEGITVYQSWWMGTIGDPVQYASISYYWKIGVYAFLCLGVLIFLIIRALISAVAVKRSNRVI